MGKGKGSFEFWATRVGPARVLFEIGTPPGTIPIREELAREGTRFIQSLLLAAPLMYILLVSSATGRR